MQPGHPLQVNPYYLGYKILVDVKSVGTASTGGKEPRSTGRRNSSRSAPAKTTSRSCAITSPRSWRRSYAFSPMGPPADCPPNTRHAVSPLRRGGDPEPGSRRRGRSLLRPRYNYGVPKVVITDTAQGVLRLAHDEEDAVLDREYAEKTLEYIHGLWKGPVLAHQPQRAGRDGRAPVRRERASRHGEGAAAPPLRVMVEQGVSVRRRRRERGKITGSEDVGVEPMQAQTGTSHHLRRRGDRRRARGHPGGDLRRAPDAPRPGDRRRRGEPAQRPGLLVQVGGDPGCCQSLPA